MQNLKEEPSQKENEVKKVLSEEIMQSSTTKVVKKVEKQKRKAIKKKAAKPEKKPAERKHKVDRDEVKSFLKKHSIGEAAEKYHISTTYAWRIKTGNYRDKK